MLLQNESRAYSVEFLRIYKVGNSEQSAGGFAIGRYGGDCLLEHVIVFPSKRVCLGGIAESPLSSPPKTFPRAKRDFQTSNEDDNGNLTRAC